MRKALYTQGYKPTGRSSPLLDFLLRYLPQMLPLSQVPKVVQKTGRSLKTKPEFQETRALIALFKDVLYITVGTSLGHPGSPPKFEGKAYSMG